MFVLSPTGQYFTAHSFYYLILEHYASAPLITNLLVACVIIYLFFMFILTNLSNKMFILMSFSIIQVLAICCCKTEVLACY